MRQLRLSTPVTTLLGLACCTGFIHSASAQSESCRVITDPSILNSNAASDEGWDEAPQLATDGNGRWIAVWRSRDELDGTVGADPDILFAVSNDDTATWSDPEAIDSEADVDSGRDETPQVTTDNQGNWIVLWSSNDDRDGLGDDFDILFVRSTDGGATWSTAAPLNTTAATDSGKDNDPQLTTDGDGNWVALWSSDEDADGSGADEDLFFARSVDDGASWTEPALLNDNADDDSGDDTVPQLVSDGNGQWVVVWQSQDDLGETIGIDADILVSLSSDAGQNWTSPALLNTVADPTTETGDDFDPQLATDGSGVWITVWYSLGNLGGTVGGDTDIIYAVSTDNGASWSESAALNTTAATDGSQDLLPQIATDGAGRWTVVWESLNTLSGTIGVDFDLLSALSTDDGATWTNPAPFNTNAGLDSRDDRAPQITTDALGLWIGVWQSTEDVDGTIGADWDLLSASFEISACTDCNLNNVPDEEDIAFGLSDDCQPDGIPDECQIIDDVLVDWIGTADTPGVGTWDVGANWCPDLTPFFPDNAGNTTFDVTIDGPDSLVTLNVSPTVSTLTLSDAAAVQVDDTSGANVRVLATDGDIVNDGIFRATDRERLFLDAPLIDQGVVSCEAGGILEAVDGILGDGEEADKSILEINRARVLGGRARTTGDNSEIHLIGGAELVDVCVQGVVVPDGQAAAFTGTIVNEGVMRVAPAGEALTFLSPIEENAVLSGNGGGNDCLRLGGESVAHLGDFDASFTNASNHLIDGTGIVFGSFSNEGTIDANNADGQRMVLSSPGEKVNSGTLRACDGGVLEINDKIMQTSSGRIEAADGGTVKINADVDGAGGIEASGGSIIIQEATVVTKCIDEPPGAPSSLIQVDAGELNVNVEGGDNFLNVGSGRFIATNVSKVDIAGPLQLCPAMASSSTLLIEDADSDVSAQTFQSCPGGALDISGSITLSISLSFSNTDEADWSWQDGSRLIMTGVADVDTVAPCAFVGLEVGGRDLGADASDGFADNFELRELRIGPGAQVALVDDEDNGNRLDSGEALYVETLTFADATGTLNLNGLNLYFRELQGDAGQIVDLDGCEIVTEPPPPPPPPVDNGNDNDNSSGNANDNGDSGDMGPMPGCGLGAMPTLMLLLVGLVAMRRRLANGHAPEGVYYDEP